MSNVPPLYGDLGKAARDLFNKGFDYPQFKISLKTKTEPGVEFETNGSHDLEKSKTSGALTTTQNFPYHGVMFTESWNTNSQLDTELLYEPPSLSGLKLLAQTAFSLTTRQNSGGLKASYCLDHVSAEVGIDVNDSNPVLRGNGVLMYRGWYFGYLIGYSVADAKLTENDLAVGYQGRDFTVHSTLNSIQECATSVYHQVNHRTEVGVITGYNFQSGNTMMGVASRYSLIDGTVLKAKVNNLGQVGVGYSQNIRDGVKLSLSALVDGRNLNAGGHKLGVALDFEP